MSLYELAICECGHARHRHTFNSYAKPYGKCKTMGSDGKCPCEKFIERPDSKRTWERQK